MAGTLRCAAALALLCAASAALAAGGYGRGRGRGRGGYGGGYGGGKYGGGYGGGSYGGGYGGGGGGYGGGGYVGGGGGGGGGGEYPYPPHIPGTNPPGPTTKNPGPPGEPTTPDPNGTTNTGAPGTGNTDLTTATTTASETATTTPFDIGSDTGLQFCKPTADHAPILVHRDVPPPSIPQGAYEQWKGVEACTTCVDGVETSHVIFVSGTSSLDTKIPAQGYTCSSNAQMRITDDQNRCFRYTGETPLPATAVLIPYCFPENSEKKCNFYVTLENPTVYDDNFGFKPENVSISEPTFLAKDMKLPLSEHLPKFIKVRTISCTGECFPITFVNCSPPPAGRKRRDVSLN